ncbi:MAG: hypothetical protein ACI4PI_02855, partial [Oscillospiraceae bacterium]
KRGNEIINTTLTRDLFVNVFVCSLSSVFEKEVFALKHELKKLSNKKSKSNVVITLNCDCGCSCSGGNAVTSVAGAAGRWGTDILGM